MIVVAMQASGFDWDDGNRSKCEQHGVGLAEIEALFAGEPRVAPDVAHSDRETRYIAVGRSEAGRSIFVSFTLREKNRRILIRPIGARFMHRKESEAYGQESPELED